jgi:hypothetical protein
MAKFKHIKCTKLSPILLETIPPQWSRHSVARRKTPARHPAVLAMAVFLSVIGIDFVGSRHLVFN